MPKVNIGGKAGQRPDPLAEKLRGRMRCMGMSMEDAAAPVMSYATFRRRLKSPEDFTRKELHHLARKLDIPIEEIRRLI